MTKKVVIFDFDGTMVDSFAVLVQAYNRVAPTLRCRMIALEDIVTLRLCQPREIFLAYNISWWKLPILVHLVRKQFRRFTSEVRVQNGMAYVIHALYKEGIMLGILLSNSACTIETLLEREGLRECFTFVASTRHVFGKHRALQQLLGRHGVVAGDCAYVGDEVRDIEAAKRVGMKAVAVTWGFQVRSGFALYKPDHIVDRPEELLTITSR